MAKAHGHYSGWVKQSEVTDRFTGPVGVVTTPGGHRVVQFAKPKRINEEALRRALSDMEERRTERRGSRS